MSNCWFIYCLSICFLNLNCNLFLMVLEKVYKRGYKLIIIFCVFDVSCI